MTNEPCFMIRQRFPVQTTIILIGSPDLHLRPVLRYRTRTMTEKTAPDSEMTQRKAEVERQAAERAQRSAEQLRANLQRRKAQVRARREGRADETEGLPASGSQSVIGDAGDAD